MPRSHCTFSITPIKICLSASQNSKSVIFSSAIIWSRKRPCAAVTLAAIVYYINLLLLLSYEMRFLVEKRSVHLGHAPAIRLMKYMRLLITNVNRRRREAKALARSPAQGRRGAPPIAINENEGHRESNPFDGAR